MALILIYFSLFSSLYHFQERYSLQVIDLDSFNMAYFTELTINCCFKIFILKKEV